MVRTEVHTYLASTFIYYPYVDTLLYLPPVCGLPGWLSSKSLPAIHEPQETRVQFLGQEHPLEDGTATHSSVLAWRIPWTEEPAGLQSMGS